MITVACVFVRGHVPFTSEYVLKLRSMVARHLPQEHRFVCLTDRPSLFRNSSVNTVEVPSPSLGTFAWWRKLNLFDSQIEELQSGRCMYLDLDTLIFNSLVPILDFNAGFALAPDDAPNFKGKGGRVTVKKFNSSVMVWNGGEQNDLYDEFKLSVTNRLWGDQDWIGERKPEAVAMPLAWFPRLSQCPDGPTHEAKVLLCKKPKNADAARAIPWVKEAWV